MLAGLEEVKCTYKDMGGINSLKVLRSVMLGIISYMANATPPNS